MSKKGNWKLAAYLAGYLILVITLAAAQPFGNPPDEGSRFLVPQYIYSRGTLPTGLEKEIRIRGYGFSYMLYNAFPYIVMGLAMQAAGLFTVNPDALFLTARMVNVLAGLGMAYTVYLLGGVLFRKERDQWLFRLAVTFQPMNLFIHSYVNTDSFCMLSTALIVYALVLQQRNGTKIRSCLILAAGVILCALSYYSAYGYILAAIALFILAFVKEKQDGAGLFDGKNFLKYAGLTAGLVAAGIGWWFIRQGIVLNGDFLGLRTRAEMTAAYGASEVQQANTFAGRGYTFFGMIGEMISRQLPGKLAVTLIAAYGALDIRPAAIFYILYMIVWGLGLAGCVMGRIRMRSAGDRRGWRWHVFHGCMLFCVILPLLLYLQYCYATDYQEQGRYLLPALVPAMYFVTKGIGRFPRWISGCCMAAIILCAAWQVFAVALPAYGVL